MGSGLLAVAGIAFCGHRAARLRAGPVSGQSPDRRPLSGGIAWGSVVAGVPHVLLAGVLGARVSTLTAIWLKADRTALAAGLYGYNGVLVGLLSRPSSPKAPRSGSMSRSARRSRPWRRSARRARSSRSERLRSQPRLLRSLGSCCSRLTVSPASQAPRCRLPTSLRLLSRRRPFRSGLEPISRGRSYRSRRCFLRRASSLRFSVSRVSP